LRDRRGDLRGRLEILEQLERSQEGVGAGVKFVMEHNDRALILGLVADLLTVPSDLAPRIDLALGDAAQRFVIAAGDLDAVLTALGPLPGRVGFIPLASVGRQPADSGFELKNQGADAPRSPVASITSLPGLVEHLLGNVLLVDTLDEAQLYQPMHPHTRFITNAGEILEPDGSVIVGPASGSIGLLSRKSELRDLRAQLLTLDAAASTMDAEQRQLRQAAAALDAPIGGRTAEITTLAAKAGDLRDTLTAQREKFSRLTELGELIVSETNILGHELSRATEALIMTRREAVAAESAAADLKTILDATALQQQQAEATRDVRQQENTAAQVALSRAKQHAASSTARVRDLQNELRDRTVEDTWLSSSIIGAEARLTESVLAALRASALAATAFARKDEYERAVGAQNTVRQALRADREARQDALRQVRDKWKQRQDQAHAHELTVRDLVNRRSGIAQRIEEDYSLVLADVAHGEPSIPESLSDDDMQNEIDDLKKKLARLGSVNLEALEQLAVDEAREQTLRREFDDLTAAQASLLEIIEAINSDSRRLSTETLAHVRIHFQELFRKLFGGGMADIILEDPTDVLESGIEITARPPGKELRSISLLSGGEKTLTAVALLLAMFRSKPSPFCLLDEVDAALDEANTARLATVVREFLDQSQFIIITHKKRTMAMADVLYGITMQESGISKQVATRIDDWPDEDSVQAA